MNKIDEVLTRGVAQILPTKDGFANLMTKKKITLYQGFDPTAPSLHIGHFIGIRKLAQFQKLGHKVIFLIGDFTGDRKSTRLNSSHQIISYAVFCLKKKKTDNTSNLLEMKRAKEADSR